MAGRFDDSRDRVLAAHAAIAAAERECLSATLAEVAAFGAEARVGGGLIMAFHAVPRGGAVWDLDDLDCSREDAVLEAVDLADLSGRRVRITRSGATALGQGTAVPVPELAVDPAAPGCFRPPSGGRAPGRAGTPATVGGTTPIATQGERGAPTVGSAVGGRLWERAVLAWVDLHRALACWTGRWLAASLVVAPETGDAASLEPLFCPDQGQDFDVVTSLRLSPETVPVDDLEAALVHVLDEAGDLTLDLVELDLKRWLAGAGLVRPGFAVHAPGECPGDCE